MSPAEGRVDLGEGLHDALQVAFRNADPGVDDPQQHAVLRVTAEPHRDTALVGELDRVRQQVEQDLLEALPVAAHPRDRRRQVDLDLDPLLQGPRLEQPHGGLDDLREIDGIVGQPDHPGLGLGDIEDVVDDVQQVGTAGPDVVGVFPVGGVAKRAVEFLPHDLGEADDRVQGRAQLVAHGGQERALRAVGALGRVLGGQQITLRPRALDHAADLLADMGHGVQRRLVRFDRVFGKELQHRRDLGADQDGKAHGGGNTDILGHMRAQEIGVLGHVHDPNRLARGQDPPGQALARRETGAHGDLAQGQELLRIGQVPDHRRRQLAGTVLRGHVGVSGRPAEVPAHLGDAGFQCLLHARRLVGGRGDDLG